MQTATDNGELQSIVEGHPRARQHLIPMLQEIQERYGYLSKESIRVVSDHLGLPEAKIFGVATFYNQFRLNVPGRHEIQVCRGTACHVRGSQSLLDLLERELKIEAGETTKDGMFSLHVVACLGACSIAPVMTVDGEFYGRLDRARVTEVLEEYRRAEASCTK